LENNLFKGGVEDQGSYKEGCCFKLHQRTDDGEVQWVFCSEFEDVKKEWMNFLATLKLKSQPAMLGGGDSAKAGGNLQVIETEVALNGSFGKDVKKFSTQYSEIGPDGKPIFDFSKDANSSDSKENDGKWVILQDWSSCTLACGGGTQTQHRVCVPPKPGGKDCEGLAIITRKCNTKKCPNTIQTTSEEVLPTKIKMMKVSKRMQNYEVFKDNIDLRNKRRRFGCYSRTIGPV